MTRTIQNILPDVSVEDLWKIVDDLPDVVGNKKHKQNMHRFFNKDGTCKENVLKTDKDFQEWHDTHVFMRLNLRLRAHVNNLRSRREDRLAAIKQLKESRNVARRTNESSPTSSEE